ncbi:MAG: electron transfer flavoprotein subunit beta/FixA family protein, partial [Gemmatimonadetes bacterium]|nr:electron transfer flavoprotein subunit beta/FixA family protein [Gemmatimonadota bacterium]
MNSIVCIKRVPATETRIRITEDGTGIDTSGVKFIVSPYDEFAIEAALQTRDAVAGGDVTVVSVGDAACGESLRAALAMGADRALLLKAALTMDGLATATLLAQELRDREAGLILFGIKAVDDDQQQVGPMVATLLGRPCATGVAEFEVKGDVVVCHREVEGGIEILELSLPAVLTITKGKYEPRYPSLKGIMAAKKKPLEVKPVTLDPGGVALVDLTLPPPRSAGRIVGEGADA